MRAVGSLTWAGLSLRSRVIGPTHVSGPASKTSLPLVHSSLATLGMVRCDTCSLIGVNAFFSALSHTHDVTLIQRQTLDKDNEQPTRSVCRLRLKGKYHMESRY